MTKAEKEQQRLRELEAIRQRNQIMAVVLFAVSILMGCLVLIPGENIWAWLHNQLMGLFGVCAIFWPILLLYIAVVTALDRHDSKMSVKIILMVVIIVLLCAAVYVFGNEFRDVSFWEELVALYGDGQIRRGAGLFSGLLGIPLVAGFGSIGAKIFTILLLFVAVMILTGTSLIKLFRVVTKPAGAAAAAVGSARDRRRVERERPAGSVDVPFDREELPQHPVQSSARPRQKSDKLEELEKVFGIGPKEKKKEKAGEAAVPAAQEPAPNPVAAAAAAQKLPSAPAAAEVVRKKEPETQETDRHAGSVCQAGGSPCGRKLSVPARNHAGNLQGAERRRCNGGAAVKRQDACGGAKKLRCTDKDCRYLPRAYGNTV